MANINITMKLEDLGKDIDQLADATKESIQLAISQLATAAYSEAIRKAQERLKTSKQDYINALDFEKLGDNIYVISLKGDHANAIEDGYGTFDMKPGLINGPKSKVSAKGTRYNTVPFYHRPSSRSPLGARQEELRTALRDVIAKHKLSKIVKDKAGVPMQGIVARIKNTGVKDLDGLVKIQKTYEKKTESYYMTFRRVSSNSDPTKWIHPGFEGVHIFDYLEKYIDVEVDRILAAILS